jgi:hypothetical protein
MSLSWAVPTGKRSRSRASSSRENSDSSPGSVATISGMIRTPSVILPAPKDRAAIMSVAAAQATRCIDSIPADRSRANGTMVAKPQAWPWAAFLLTAARRARPGLRRMGSRSRRGSTARQTSCALVCGETRSVGWKVGLATRLPTEKTESLAPLCLSIFEGRLLRLCAPRRSGFG